MGDSNLPGALPSVKAGLDKLMERTKAAQEKLAAVEKKTKDQRERAQAAQFVKTAKEKTDAVDVALEKVDEAELPFLKGIESLPLQEAMDTIKESETVSAAAQKAITEARPFIAAKGLEMKKYNEGVVKDTNEEFTKLTERVNAANAKLTTFKTDTANRKKGSQIQDTSEKITALEA